MKAVAIPMAHPRLEFRGPPDLRFPIQVFLIQGPRRTGLAAQVAGGHAGRPRGRHGGAAGPVGVPRGPRSGEARHVFRGSQRVAARAVKLGAGRSGTSNSVSRFPFSGHACARRGRT